MKKMKPQCYVINTRGMIKKKYIKSKYKAQRYKSDIYKYQNKTLLSENWQSR